MNIRSVLLTSKLVEQAADILRPGIEKLIADEKRLAVYIVVLDATVPYNEMMDIDRMPFLFRGTIGEADQSLWQGKTFDKNAKLKARLSWRTGMPAHVVLRQHPQLLEENDFKYGGSDVRPGIIAAASGLAWHHDLLIASAIVSMCDALSIGALEESLKVPNLQM